jgi:hypothetical protein
MAAVAACFASVSASVALPCPPEGCETLATPFDRLTDEPGELAGAFRLILGSSVAQTSQTMPLDVMQELSAKQTSYVHAAYRGGEQATEHGGMRAPHGLSVLGADLFFTGTDELIETSLLVRADDGTESAIDELERRWGVPDFEVVLPGSLTMVVGWKGPHSYALATFSDLSVFELSIFEDRPEDLLAGTQIVLYEGLLRCSRQLDAGQSPDDVMPQLMEIVRWVEDARRVIRPR